jgi:hypothetical protein
MDNETHENDSQERITVSEGEGFVFSDIIRNTPRSFRHNETTAEPEGSHEMTTRILMPSMELLAPRMVSFDLVERLEDSNSYLNFGFSFLFGFIGSLLTILISCFEGGKLNVNDLTIIVIIILIVICVGIGIFLKITFTKRSTVRSDLEKYKESYENQL